MDKWKMSLPAVKVHHHLCRRLFPLDLQQLENNRSQELSEWRFKKKKQRLYHYSGQRKYKYIYIAYRYFSKKRTLKGILSKPSFRWETALRWSINPKYHLNEFHPGPLREPAARKNMKQTSPCVSGSPKLRIFERTLKNGPMKWMEKNGSF